MVRQALNRRTIAGKEGDCKNGIDVGHVQRTVTIFLRAVGRHFLWPEKAMVQWQ